MSAAASLSSHVRVKGVAGSDELGGARRRSQKRTIIIS